MSSLLCVAALLVAIFSCSCLASIYKQIGSSGAIYSALADDTAITTVALVGSKARLPNLSVTAQLARLDRKLKPIILLNVTWHEPDVGMLATQYHIQVHSMADDNDKYCQPKGFAEKSTMPSTTTSFLMPHVLEPDLASSYLKIRPGCQYNVTLFNDILPHDIGVTVNYTVPDCVGPICDCKRFLEIARPEVTQAKQLNATLLNVTWSYPATDRGAVGVNITHFNVALRTAHGHAHHGIYSPSTILVVPLSRGNNKKKTQYQQVIPLSDTLQSSQTYKVEVSAENVERGCYGPSGGVELEVPVSQEDLPVASGSGMWLTVLSSVTFVLACTLACTMVWQRCGGWFKRRCLDRNLQPVQWQGIYKAVVPDVSRTRPNFPPMQHSVIYVEKEIEEAKARGEADMLEVGFGRLELGREIGKGAFGRVFLARAECIAGNPGFTTVAVKKLKQKAKSDEVEEFLSEIAMLKQVGRHPNIVTLLGCVTIRQPYCMIMEYIPCGDLLQYLRRLRVEYERRTGSELPFLATRCRPPPRSPRYVELSLSSDSDCSYIQPQRRTQGVHRPSTTETEWSLLSNEDSTAPLTPARHATDGNSRYLEYTLDPKELQNFAVQIARGMEHLEKIQITHRDLAARNVLIDENKTLKISDFGLSRSGIYVNTKRKKVPLRWLSVEAMRDNLYSSQSDVWAFAIVLWEIGTLGGFPYPTINDFDLLNFLLDGKRLDKPDNCTDELYSLMLSCWSHSADSRPTFTDLVSHLDSVICRRRVYVNFEDLRPDYTFPPTEQLKTGDDGSTPGDDKDTSAMEKKPV